jgi:RNA polymerase sigma-70 factor (ECF subfamily)
VDERAMCEKYARRIHGYGLRYLRDRAAAQDFAQHVLLAVLQAVRAGRVEDMARLDGYVLGTCRNALRDARRGDLRQRRLVERSAAGLPEGYEPAFLEVDRARLERCLFGLDVRERAIVVATFVEDKDADEIGRTLSLTPGNVRVIRHRALARLQACVEGAPS